MRRASIQSDGYFCTGDSGESFTAMCNMPDLYLVEGLNQVRRRGEEFAVKKKTFTTKDTRGRENFKRTFSTQARRSTAMVQHEEPIRSS